MAHPAPHRNWPQIPLIGAATADQQARIFEPFFSLRSGGTGLGLFVSLNSVRRWGGDIHVASTPGQGSTFEVALPLS